MRKLLTKKFQLSKKKKQYNLKKSLKSLPHLVDSLFLNAFCNNFWWATSSARQSPNDIFESKEDEERAVESKELAVDRRVSPYAPRNPADLAVHEKVALE